MNPRAYTPLPLIVLIGFLVLYLLGGPQSEAQAPSSETPLPIAQPIAIEQSGEIFSESGKNIRLSFTNTSTKYIKAFVLIADLKDQQGKSCLSQIHTAILGLRDGPRIPQNRFPGETWETRLTTPLDVDGNAYNATLSIDYVLFDDGSHWGPDSEHRSAEIRGVITATKMERSRLRRKLRKEGIKSVVTDLEQ